MRSNNSWDEENSELILDADALAREILPAHDVKVAYYNDPIAYFAKRHDTHFPPKLRQIFIYIYDRVKAGIDTHIMMTAPRGGGKSKLTSCIEFSFWYFLDADTINSGGSEEQAKIVYQYLRAYIYNDEAVEREVDRSLMSYTCKKGKPPTPYITSVACSEKQVRGPHPGGERKAVGVIVIDEAALVDEDVMFAALPMIDTAGVMVSMLLSTFNQVSGPFQELWDNEAEEVKFEYMKVQWDAFDVCEPCTDKCEDCYKKFTEKYCGWSCKCKDKYGIDKEYPANQFPIKADSDAHAIYCVDCRSRIRRKARDCDGGWLKISRIKWYYENKPESWFEVEIMGLRPGGESRTFDTALLEEAITDVIGMVQPEITHKTKRRFQVDWGFSGETAIQVWQIWDNGLHEVIATKYFTEEVEGIYTYLKAAKLEYGTNKIYADSSHPFENARLEKLGFDVRTVDFGQEKEICISAVINQLEKRAIRVDLKYKKLIKAIKSSRRDPKSKKVVKTKTDHPFDAFICGFADDIAVVRPYTADDPGGMDHDVVPEDGGYGGEHDDISTYGGEDELTTPAWHGHYDMEEDGGY